MSARAEEPLADALRRSLESLEAGDSLDAVLARHPDQAEALRPLLESALALRQLPIDPAPADLAGRIGTALVSEARQASDAGRRAARARRPRHRLDPRRWLPAGPTLPPVRNLVFRLGAIAIALALVFSGAARASADSLPGSALYPVKRGIEQVRLVLATETREPALAADFARRRLEEAEALSAAGRSPEPALAGLEDLSAWASSLPAAAQTAVAARDELDAGMVADVPNADTVRSNEAPDRRSSPAANPATAAGSPPIVRRAPTRALVVAPVASPSPRSASNPYPTPTEALLASAPSSTPMPAVALAATERPTTSPVPLTATPPPPPPDDDDDDDPPPPSATATASLVPSATPTLIEPTATATDPGWNVVEGQVLTVVGRAIPSARVTFIDAVSGDRVAAGSTDARGSIRIRLLRGRYQVVAMADGFQTQWYRGKSSRDEADVIGLTGDGLTVAVNFRLQPDAPLSNRATEAPRRPRPSATPETEPSPEPSATQPSIRPVRSPEP